MHDAFVSGNGNGNKMNLRIEIIENLLNASGDGTSAKINSLKQAVKRNKSDMADNTFKSLDVLRKVFQHEMTDEIRQIIDRHLRTTFAPAFENLRRNGHEVSQNDIDELCVEILDGAKEPFQKDISKPKDVTADGRIICIPSQSVIPRKASLEQKVEESDYDIESDSSMVSHGSTIGGLAHGALYNKLDRGASRPKKRGRPRKVDVDCGRSGTPIIQGTQPVTPMEAFKWNPERIVHDTRFVLGSKVNKALAVGHRSHIFARYTRSFRYTADEEDRAWLIDQSITTRTSGKVFFMVLDDVLEIAQLENAPPQAHNDLRRYSFIVPEKIVMKIRLYMAAPFEKLKARVVSSSGGQSGAPHLHYPHQQQQLAHSQPNLVGQHQPPPPLMANLKNFAMQM